MEAQARFGGRPQAGFVGRIAIADALLLILLPPMWRAGRTNPLARSR